MLIKKVSKILILIALVAIMFNGCKKTDSTDTTPVVTNPTNGKTTAVFNPNLTYGTMTDQDGNVYKTIVIGTQTWMAENLRTTKYRDGSAIPVVTSNTAWAALSTGAYCNYNNTANNDTIATFGRLYNWYAATDTRNIAPTGWHIPTDAEWTTLTTTLLGESVAGGKLKEAGTIHWTSPNTSADNSSGFTALPSGYCYYYDGSFGYLGYYGYWWSSTALDASGAWSRVLLCYDRICSRNYAGKQFGFAVRLLKD